jgi:hypothetical protein
MVEVRVKLSALATETEARVSRAKAARKNFFMLDPPGIEELRERTG